MARPIIPAEERFMQFVSPEPNSGCWLWTGCVDKRGYGRVSLGSRGAGKGGLTALAHRISYASFVSPVPSEMCVLHRCDTPRCVNPAHLFLGTRQDNNSDTAAKGRGIKSASGLPYGVKFHHVCKSRPFQSRVTFRGKQHSLGYFVTAEEANAVAVAFRNLMVPPIPLPEPKGDAG